MLKVKTFESQKVFGSKEIKGSKHTTIWYGFTSRY